MGYSPWGLKEPDTTEYTSSCGRSWVSALTDHYNVHPCEQDSVGVLPSAAVQHGEPVTELHTILISFCEFFRSFAHKLASSPPHDIFNWKHASGPEHMASSVSQISKLIP